jgi:hypothetical protein
MKKKVKEENEEMEERVNQAEGGGGVGIIRLPSPCSLSLQTEQKHLN